MSKPNNFKVQSLEFVGEAKLLFSWLLFFTFYVLSFTLHAQTLIANAGGNTSVCLNDSVQIGGNPSATGGTPPYSYSWQPITGLDNPASANPNAFPTSLTTYTLTVTDGTGKSSMDMVNVDTLPLPMISAGSGQTIASGTSTFLQGSGGVNYIWFPVNGLTNQNSAAPFAEPGFTTTYCVAGTDANGCINTDCMILTVILGDTIVIYNTFTPNGDGENDFFYIGNILKFPKSRLQVFNRNGKIVLEESPYINDWNGRVDGVDLPCATYYFVLSPGSGKSKMQGSVTIIR